MSEKVKNMFSSLAESYDLANDVFSVGMHRNWKKKAIKLAEINDNDIVLDIATGTGDLALKIKQNFPKSKVFGLDFSHKMLDVAKERANNERYDIEFIEGDVLNLPFKDESINKCFISYGIRNVDSTEKCLQEIFRVLKKNGILIILETGKPEGPVKIGYNIYTKTLLPKIGKLVTKDEVSYKYLSDTANNYPFGSEFMEIMKSSTNFKYIKYYKLFFGSSYIYRGVK